jgi:uncharacterized secreted protein with C-terminal beta-propeller domain
MSHALDLACPKRMNRILFASVALCLWACSPNHPPAAVPPPLDTGVVRQAQLVTHSTCGSLETEVKAKLVNAWRADLGASLRSALSNHRHGYWGFADAGYSAGGAGGGTSSAGPVDVTHTNVQVVGVDEPDIMKNDGDRIFVLSKGKLFASRSWPATALALQGSLALSGTPAEMFLDGDRVIVFSNALRLDRGITLATLIDVSDLSTMKVVGQYEVPGTYRSARRTGASVRMVTLQTFAWPAGVVASVPYWSRKWNSDDEIIAEHARLAAENERLIAAATLEQLLPTAYWHGATAVPFGIDCGAVHLSTGITQPGYSEVATFQIDTPAQLQRQVLYEAADEVYADSDSLYFTSHHRWWNGPGPIDATYIHKFDTSSPASAKYVASGVIDGHLVDQFAMDEWNGNLRVAATVNATSPVWGLWSEVSVLAQAGSRLVEVGKSARLANGERITSARFLGEVGYVVTFRQTDPLFVFDLADPAHPKQLGELKVPGFSSYIHPLDATHLLTIGTYQSETGGWATRAVQLAIFDVSDLTAPKQTHLQLLGDYSSSSAAQSEHRAFNYFPAKKLLAVPFQRRDSSNGLESDLRVFAVDAQQGFTSRGALTMSDLGSSSIVERSVMADDFVYAISAAGIRVANVSALQTPLATAKF